MKSATPQLVTFLNSARQCARLDLYTITLPSGLVLRYTDAATPIDWQGATYAPLRVSRSGIKTSRGTEVDTLTIDIEADGTDLVNGRRLIPFITGGGFDGATVVLQRAFAADRGQPLIGVVTMFAGRQSGLRDCGRSSVSLEVSSWLELLDANMPADVYQPGCLHTLFDTGCGLSRAAYAVAGQVTAAGDVLFDTDLANAAGYFDQGAVVFTSGANAGVRRTIKSQTGDGYLRLPLALPTAAAVGDRFLAYPGCDRTMATCKAKFSNLLRYKGYPYVPPAETAT